MFRTVPLSIIKSFSLYTQQWYMCWELGMERTDPARKLSANIPLLCVQWKPADDGQRNCPKHVEFYSKNKIWEISASGWFYYESISRCTVTWTSKSILNIFVCQRFLLFLIAGKHLLVLIVSYLYLFGKYISNWLNKVRPLFNGTLTLFQNF